MTSDSVRRIVGVWGVLAAVGLVVLMVALAQPFEPDSFGPGHDARAYWAAPLGDPYEPGSVGEEIGVPLFARLPGHPESAARPPLAPLPGPLDGRPAGGPLLVGAAAPVPAAPAAGPARDLGRQHHHPAGRRHRARLQPAVGVGLPAPDQGHPGRGRALVRGPARVAQHGDRHRGHRWRSSPRSPCSPPDCGPTGSSCS